LYKGKGGEMERITITVEKRGETGKGVARSLRRNYMIPAILYRGGDSLPIKIPKKEITQFINTTSGEQVMVNLQFKDGENKLALMKYYQVDPTNRELLHVDFFELLLTATSTPEILNLPFKKMEEAKREIIGKYDTDMGGLGGERLEEKGGNTIWKQQKSWRMLPSIS
jgi:ribosomal protein L25 (general stress protein Ctc)